MTTLVVGAGIFGVTTALALRRRGRSVTLIDPGPIPHPLAESTDISKVVRLDYGADELYTGFMERALEQWRRWNAGWSSPLFHETGVLFLTRAAMAPGGFEHDSHALLTSRGHVLERLDAASIAARFPAWSSQRYVDGYFNAQGGYVESGAVVERLAAEAKAAGVEIVAGVRVSRLAEGDSDVTGVVTDDGVTIRASSVVLACGSWTADLVPTLAPHLVSVGQPVFHLAGSAQEFEAVRFPVFGADIAKTGWYGFPANRGIVKVANHGVGREVHPSSSSRIVSDEEHRRMRAFLQETFPALAAARVSATRVCTYCDTRDRHFWIAPDPTRPSLVVAAGGSGHAFKFAPLVGDWIANAVEGSVEPRFRWRECSANGREGGTEGGQRGEAARNETS